MNTYLSSKVKIGISACTFGCKYRYNSKGWDQLAFIGRDKGSFTWFPVCPEVNAGLGIPRDAIHIAGENGAAVWQGEAKVKSMNGTDITELLMVSSQWCLESLKTAGVHVFVYMEGSPSCGVYRTTLKNRRLGKPPGVFGHLLLKEGFFLIPAQDLSSPIRWWDWRRRMLAFLWLKDQPLDTKQDVYAMWHVLKFLCQEIDEKRSRQIGSALAQLDKNAGKSTDAFEPLRTELLDMLRRPSSVSKIKNRLWKHYQHFRKVTGQSIEGILEPTDLRSMTLLAEELLKMELKAMETGVLFGASPISNRKPKGSAVLDETNKK